ncbi:hypothetical protein F3S47_15355 [Histidinibacterium aquaticum]|uniref:Uncharacterized protein n=1 Tax=Histidinibacterium aquaticum TaxID=2613962 RepID=A0A5J5GEN0_9RHOB|nr:hypothetical protein F3S47_15355 [Histidinibacterium aquaticum]
MTRRTIPSSQRDDLSFPIRIKIVVPHTGLGNRLDDVIRWCRENVGSGEFAQGTAKSFGCDATAFYFRRIESGAAFIQACPEFDLADGSQASTSHR